MSFLGTTPSAPTARSPSQELSQSLAALIANEPAQYAADRTYQPLYGQLNLDLAAQNMLGYDVAAPTPPSSTLPAPGSTAGAAPPVDWSQYLNRGRGNVRGQGGGRQSNQVVAANAIPPTPATPGHHPGTLELNTLQRTADINDVMRLGPAATAAMLNANPWLAGSLGNLYGRLADSGVLQLLNSQAMAALQSGGRLSPQEQTDLDQQTRAGFAARGQLYGNQALGAELLNRDAAVRARQAAAQQLATQVEGLNRSQSQLALAAPTVFSSTLSDPFMSILSRPSGASPAIASSMFNPQSPYFSDLFNTNYNAQAAANIAGANNNAALIGAGIKAVGSLAGGAIASDRRVKKDIRDTGLKTHGGIPLKTFRYRAGAVAAGVSPASVGQKFVGPMAGEVQKRFPHAVRTMALPKSIMLGNRPVRNVKMIAHPELMPKPC